MTFGDGIRRNVAKISQAERTRLREAILQLDTSKFYPDGVSYWDMQEKIHKDAHLAGQDVHDGPAFLPWHRELCNRFEALLREVDPQLSLHYWDWTTDPRATPSRAGRTVNLFTPQFMGSALGDAGPPLQNFESSEDAEIHNGHTHVWRKMISGPPAVASDNEIVTAGDDKPHEEQYPAMEAALHAAHDYMHSAYIRGSIRISHYSFHDPFVFLLHSNVDRLWAMWQTAPGKTWRLDPSSVYGTDGNAPSINAHLEPWSGGTTLQPWVPPSHAIQVKTSKHPSVVVPPVYDTNARTVRHTNRSRSYSLVR